MWSFRATGYEPISVRSAPAGSGRELKVRRFWAMSHHPNQTKPITAASVIRATAMTIGTFALVYVSLLISRGLELVMSSSPEAFHVVATVLPDRLDNARRPVSGAHSRCLGAFGVHLCLTPLPDLSERGQQMDDVVVVQLLGVVEHGCFGGKIQGHGIGAAGQEDFRFLNISRRDGVP